MFETSTRTKSTIPKAAEIIAVLTACADSIPSVASAAMHLAMPYDVCVGSDVWRNGGLWSFRGETAPIFENDVDAAVMAAIDLANRTQRPGDKYLALTDDRGSWVKVLASGTVKIAFGLSLLTGKTFTCERNADDEYVLEAVNRIFDGGSAMNPAASQESFADFASRVGVSEESARLTLKNLFGK